MKNSLQLKDEKEQLKKECLELIDKGKSELRELTAEEAKELEKKKAQIQALNEELKSLEERLGRNEITHTNTTKEMEFRLLSVVNDIVNNRNLSEAAQAVITTGANEMRKCGLSFGGQIQLPVNEIRSDVTTTSASGAVETQVFDILAPLRHRNVLIQAGAKFMTGLVGNVQVPIVSGGNVSWEDETAEAKDANYSVSQVTLSPKRLTAFVDISKQFLVQDSKSAEEIIRTDLITAINSKLESTVLGKEQGGANKPTGLFYSSSALSDIMGYGGLLNMESELDYDNLGELVYVMSNSAKAALRQTTKSVNNTRFIMEDGTIDGVPVFATSSAGKDKLVACGYFNQLAVGQWGALDITVDPYTVAKEGKVRLVVNAFFDAKVLRPEAIKVGQFK